MKMYFYYGAMGSSKTANALMTRFSWEDKGKKVALLKPSIDNRDGVDIVKSRHQQDRDIRVLCGIVRLSPTKPSGPKFIAFLGML